MTIQGEMIIGRRVVRGSAGTTRAFNPATRAEMEPAFGLATADDIATACALAEGAFDTYRNLPLEQRARFLETIADRIMDIGPALIERASAESGLPPARSRNRRSTRTATCRWSSARASSKPSPTASWTSAPN